MSTTRNTSGKFVVKSEHPRKIRSVNLTDKAWQWLADVASCAGISRNDYLEAMAEGYVPSMETVSVEIKPLMETVEPEPSPIMEAVSVESKPIMETVEPEPSPIMEAVSVESKPIMETVEPEPSPIMEAVSVEIKPLIETVKSDYDALLESSARVTNNLKEEVQRLRSQLDVQKADWSELLADFENSEAVRTDLVLQVQMLQSELGAIRTDRPEIQKSVLAVADFPEPSDLLNQLRTRRKKSRADLADIEVILELLNQAGSSL
ncbi:MAG: hypothetical protein U7126_28785 [Microcoleus sp.]